MTEPPAGYRPLSEVTFLVEKGFNVALGKIHYRQADGALSLAVRLGPGQMNPDGIAHGGMLASLADLSFGGAIYARGLAKHGMATVSLTMSYMDAGREGDWLECQATLNRVGHTMIFATAMLSVGERPVAQASAVFKVFHPKAG